MWLDRHKQLPPISCCWAEHSQLSLSFKMWLNCFRERNPPKSLYVGYAFKNCLYFIKNGLSLFFICFIFLLLVFHNFPGKKSKVSH